MNKGKNLNKIWNSRAASDGKRIIGRSYILQGKLRNHTLGNKQKDQQTGIGREISDSKGMLRLEQTNKAKK